ncbi:MAG: hypothetical protein GY839_05210 [candidate division Zixibacteria bacterium]|nr:hypothetical protein [candidate division Zixibacteria bacterium]
MAKIDFKKNMKHLYKPSAKNIVFVDLPAMNFLMIDGKGDPNTAQEYKDSIEALYAVSYTLKFMIKKGPLAIDYGVMPLEGLWWVDDMSKFSVDDKSGWEWTSMIMQPDYVTRELVDQAMEQAAKKKNPPALDKLRFESFAEGYSAQILHIGSFADEGPTIKKLHDSIVEANYKNIGKHHEIYLSDFRRTVPEKLKTVIRQPCRKQT